MKYENKLRNNNYIIGILFSIIIISFASYILLNPDQMNNGKGLDSTFKLVAQIMLLTAVLLMFLFIRSAMSPPIIFSFDNNGFTYKPNGVSFGFIEWQDVIEIREISIIVTKGIQVEESVLNVVLKEPIKYIKKVNIFIRPLLFLRYKMTNSPVIINTCDLGKEPLEILAQIEKFVPVILYNDDSK
jgi:hypothetical protein